MYSSEDIERFYFQYQTGGLPNGISIQDFCIKNKVNKAEQTVIFFYEDGSRGRDVLVNFLGDAD